MIRHFTTLSLLALVASCTSQNAPAPKPAFDSSRNPDLLAPDLYPGGAVAPKEPVVRYGRYTLQVLAGPAWQVKVDEVNRQICYVLRPGYQLPNSAQSASMQIAQAIPPTSAQPVSVSTTSNNATTKVLVTTAPPSAPVIGAVATPANDQ